MAYDASENPVERRFEGRTCVVTVNNGIATVIAKQGREQEALLAKRHVFLSWLRKAGLPSGVIVPATQMVSMPGVPGGTVLEYEFVEGRELGDFLAAHPMPESQKIAERLGEFLAWLHQLPPHEAQALIAHASLEIPEKHNQFADPSTERVVLLNDVHGRNVIVSPNGSVALLDVNDACEGDPAAEFRKLFFKKDTAGAFADAVLEKYLEVRSFPETETAAFRKRVELYTQAYGERRAVRNSTKQT